MNRGRTLYLLFPLFLFLLVPTILRAEEKKPEGPPPAKVQVSRASTGKIAPEGEYIGTVYYVDVSDIAAEVDGKVEQVFIEEGQRVKNGRVLVRLSSDILRKTLEGKQASHGQILAELENARLDLQRVETLFKQESIAEQVYDETRFRVKALEQNGSALKAEVDRLELEISKKKIIAPFDGIVLKRNVDVGEWLSSGGVIATIARDDEVEVVVSIPQDTLEYVKPGMTTLMNTGKKIVRGKVFAIVPRGDLATRTFPVKIRTKNVEGLREGMEARVKLPVGKKEEVLIVPRDAVITKFGMTVVYAVNDNKAKMIPVKLVAYEGMDAGVHAQGLKPDMYVVVKGNERLNDDQPVVIENGGASN